jgi:hypothetical protein
MLKKIALLVPAALLAGSVLAAPASAETVKKVIIKKHGHHDMGRHHGWGRGHGHGHGVKKVIIKHRD